VEWRVAQPGTVTWGREEEGFGQRDDGELGLNRYGEVVNRRRGGDGSRRLRGE